jgi:hypothetical protein
VIVHVQFSSVGAGMVWGGPSYFGCHFVGCSVVSGRPLRSRAVTGVSMHDCVCLVPVLASHATSLPAAAAADWRGLGWVHIVGWSYD